MYKKRPINIINYSFIFLLITLYLLLLIAVTQSNVSNNDIKYIIGIAFALFFGQPMKSIYDFIISNHFNFSEDIPYEFRIKKKQVYITIDICSFGGLVFLLALFSSNLYLTVAIFIFFIGFLVLGLYSLFSSDHYKKL